MVRTLRLCALSTLLLTSTAVGQAPGDYEALIREALSEFSAGNWPEAYSLFVRAHAVSPSARTLRGMGLTSFELREYPRSIAELQASLDSAVQPLTDEQRGQVQTLLERARRFVATVQVSLEPPDANLLVDGAPTDARTLTVGVGEVRLRAEREGHQAAERTLSVVGGQRYPVSLFLPPLAEGTAAPPLATESDAAEDTSGAESAWLWAGVGAVVVTALAVGLLVGSSGGDDGAPRSNTGVAFQALSSAAP